MRPRYRNVALLSVSGGQYFAWLKAGQNQKILLKDFVKQISVAGAGLSIVRSAFKRHPQSVDRPFLLRLGRAEYGGFFMGE